MYTFSRLQSYKFSTPAEAAAAAAAVVVIVVVVCYVNR